MRPAIEAACEAYVHQERDCFTRWCALFDRRGTPDPAVVIASQERLHRAAEALRRLCLAGPAVAEAERRELMRLQVLGENTQDAGVRRCRAAEARAEIRQRWAADRWRIVQCRDALTAGLGWPHRGEPVTATGWSYRAGHTVTGPGLYLHDNDIYQVTHQVWMPGLAGGRHEATVRVAWEPHLGGGTLGNADPAGRISMRVASAPSRDLPVPLPRWPAPHDVGGDTDPLLITPPGVQLELFA